MFLFFPARSENILGENFSRPPLEIIRTFQLKVLPPASKGEFTPPFPPLRSPPEPDQWARRAPYYSCPSSPPHSILLRPFYCSVLFPFCWVYRIVFICSTWSGKLIFLQSPALGSVHAGELAYLRSLGGTAARRERGGGAGAGLACLGDKQRRTSAPEVCRRRMCTVKSIP